MIDRFLQVLSPEIDKKEGLLRERGTERNGVGEESI